MTTHPTDKELEAFAIEEQFLLFCDEDEFTQIARAVLAKWGTPPTVAGEPVFAFRRKGFDNFCTCTEKRYAELSAKPKLFETRIFYTTPPVQADNQPAPTGEPWHGHQFKEVRHGYWQCDCGKAIKEAEPTPIADKDSYPPLPSRYTYDDDEEELFSADQMLAFADSTHALRASHGQAQAAPQTSPTPQADSVTAPAAGAVAHTISDAQIEAMPVWRNFVGLWPESRREIVDAVVDLLAAAPTPPAQAADSVLEDAAQVEIDLFNDLNRIYGNTLTAYAKELCRLGYRKTNAARKQGETNEH